MIEINSLKKSD